MWESAKKMDAAVLISQITEIKIGQVTPVFLKNPIPQCEVSTGHVMTAIFTLFLTGCVLFSSLF